MAWILVDTRVCVWWTLLCKKNITLNKELRFGKYSKVRGDPKVMETMKRSWNLISPKKFKPCLFGAFTLSLTIQTGECPEALGIFFVSWLCMSSPIVISEHQTSPGWRWIMLSGNNTRFSLPLYSHTHPQCITSKWLDSTAQKEVCESAKQSTLCGFKLSEDSFWVALCTKCLLIFCFCLKELLLSLIWNLFLNKISTKYTCKAHKWKRGFVNLNKSSN